MFRNFIFIGLIFMFSSCAMPAAEAMILINEILADPPTGLAGDANGDGVGSSNDDEFVELFNAGNFSMDLSGWSLNDALQTRHVFPSGTWIPSQKLLVIFGGGSPQITAAPWQIASTGTLSLNNAGDTVTLYNLNHDIIDQMMYGTQGGQDQSLARSPEGSGDHFVLHLSLANAGGQRFSPGYFVNPPVEPVEPVAAAASVPASVPEGNTFLCFALGLMLLVLVRTPVAQAVNSRF